jgi:hypothetical protein
MRRVVSKKKKRDGFEPSASSAIELFLFIMRYVISAKKKEDD